MWEVLVGHMRPDACARPPCASMWERAGKRYCRREIEALESSKCGRKEEEEDEEEKEEEAVSTFLLN